MAKILITGFPGFLGSELLPRVLARAADAEAVCLVQAKFAELARAKADELVAADPSLAGRIHLAPGDITDPGLALDRAGTSPEELRREVVEIFHLAAIYDLSVRREPALKVNVDGTRNVLRFAADCPGLRRLHYVSTCYVSGRYAGAFAETDLVKGQTFNNFYEETKFLAEVKVQEWMEKGLPVTVYRPSIVVGDSRTGATAKYDGPYYVIRWILKQPGVAFLPMIGQPERTRVNVVPSDFVIAAIDHLAGREESLGQVYQLADPDPPTVSEMIETISRVAEKRVIRVPTFRGVAKASLEYVPFLERLMGIPAEALDYFVHPTYYLTENARRDLAGTGIEVPPFPSYAERLVEFVRA
ncbi:MAG TPA: SDR family oxidoreductase, partial [Thermoanaerobaculia bacterium]|nr:SDR family oxidoreductase [Thermoanaerobaculia bacterium]